MQNGIPQQIADAPPEQRDPRELVQMILQTTMDGTRRRRTPVSVGTQYQLLSRVRYW